MKAFVSSLFAMALIGVSAWAVLTQCLDYSSQASYTSTKNNAVRLGE